MSCLYCYLSLLISDTKRNYLDYKQNDNVTKNKKVIGEESLQLVTERAVPTASSRCYQSSGGSSSRPRLITKNFLKTYKTLLISCV
jgi:hypothetical protein